MGNMQQGGQGGMGGMGGGGFPSVPGDTAKSHVDPDPTTFIEGGTPVYVNVYHLQPAGPLNALNGSVMGLGIFHSGVQVGDSVEYAFGGDMANPDRPGCFQHPPRAILPEHQFHRSHHVGNLPTAATATKVKALVDEMGDRARGGWTGGSYNLMLRNCNHFAEALVQELSTRFVEPAGGVPLEYPGYVNRAAKLGSGMVPPGMLDALRQAAPKPPGASESSGPQQQQQSSWGGSSAWGQQGGGQQSGGNYSSGGRGPADASSTPGGGSGAPPPRSRHAGGTSGPAPHERRSEEAYKRHTQQPQQRPAAAADPTRPSGSSTSSASPSSTKASAASSTTGQKPTEVYSEDDLQQMPAKQLRQLAVAYGLDPRTMLEKPDFVAAIVKAQG